MKRILSVVFALLLLLAPLAQAETASISLGNLADQDIGAKVQCVPYTVKKIGDGIYRISDNLGSEPLPLDAFGCYNSSDMYLILGTEKALMVDLSNNITRDNAVEVLSNIVNTLRNDLPLEIAIGHGHVDHVGMWSAFTDADVPLYFPEGEYDESMEDAHGIHEDQITNFIPSTQFDLGGRVLDTYELPGHTDHSNIYVLKNENLMFSSDAIGSGANGVWLMQAEALNQYNDNLSQFVEYINTNFDDAGKSALKIHSGHAWQYQVGLGWLDWRYVQDMVKCVEKIKAGAWSDPDSGLSIGEWEIEFFGNRLFNFTYGKAVVVSTYEAACELAGINPAS